jgi:hypothetical protein
MPPPEQRGGAAFATPPLDEQSPESVTTRQEYTTAGHDPLVSFAIFRVAPDEALAPKQFQTVARYVTDLCGESEIDRRDEIAFHCSLSYDSSIYHNPSATEMEVA